MSSKECVSMKVCAWIAHSVIPTVKRNQTPQVLISVRAYCASPPRPLGAEPRKSSPTQSNPPTKSLTGYLSPEGGLKTTEKLSEQKDDSQTDEVRTRTSSSVPFYLIKLCTHALTHSLRVRSSVLPSALRSTPGISSSAPTAPRGKIRSTP